MREWLTITKVYRLRRPELFHSNDEGNYAADEPSVSTTFGH
jgi:hypothetical protein